MEKMVKTQVSFYEQQRKDFQKYADENHEGNFSLAIRFLAQKALNRHDELNIKFNGE